MTVLSLGCARFLRVSFLALAWFAAASTMLAAGDANAAASTLVSARDFTADARAASQARIPIIVLISLEGCHHCETVRNGYLLPLSRRTTGGGAPPIIRQVELGGSAPLVDFTGRSITHAEFAQRHRARIAPVVLFLDARGRPLAEPLVGAMIADFYGAYFDSALEEASRKAQADPAR